MCIRDSVQGQDIGLEGNAVDDADDVDDLVCGGIDLAHGVDHLADHGAAAAREIKVLIGDSVEKVSIGARLVDQAGGTMQEIVLNVRRVTDIIGEITTASVEQTSGIEQINRAIAQMDEVTQQNAALVEEAAAAAAALQDQSQALAQAVSVFRLARTVPAGAHGGPGSPALAYSP